MDSSTELRYTWSPNKSARIVALLFGVALLVLFFVFRQAEAFARILALFASFIAMSYGFRGLIRQPLLEITDENIIIRRTFRNHVYPRYAIHGFRVEKAVGLLRRSGFISLDIARVEDWGDLRREYLHSRSLPTTLPPLKDRERDILEVLSWGDVGVSPEKMVADLEAHKIRNLSKTLNI